MKFKIRMTVFFMILAVLLSGCDSKSPSAPSNGKNTHKTPPLVSSDIQSSDSSDTNSEVEDNSSDSATDNSSSKIMTSAQGKNYLIIKPIENHPGVAGLDAKYQMMCMDKLGNVISAEDFLLSANNSKIKIDGSFVTIPYELRKPGKTVTIGVTLKSQPQKKGTYTFDFIKYTDTATFSDDFDTIDFDIWNVGSPSEPNAKAGVVEDGKLVFKIDKEGQEPFLLKSKFTQSYGCFSARIKMPKQGKANCAFWLKTVGNGKYIKNLAFPPSSGGEIDIIEFFPNWKNRWSATLHWNCYKPEYLSSSGDEHMPGIGITDDYHIISAVWTKTGIYWYYDSELVRSYTEPEGLAKDSDPMEINVQLVPEYNDDKTWGGTYDPNAFPYEMRTDWVRAYGIK